MVAIQRGTYSETSNFLNSWRASSGRAKEESAQHEKDKYNLVCFGNGVSAGGGIGGGGSGSTGSGTGGN